MPDSGSPSRFGGMDAKVLLMNRKKRFFSNLAVGYLAVAANFIFTIFSVPIALHYLSKEEFGLWSLILQITNYFLLMELGMSSSLARFLADHKDSKDQAAYGNALQTGRTVLVVQALAIMGLAFSAGLLLHGWLEIPPYLIPAFQRLVWIQGGILAAGLFLRSYSSPLWAHQRLDITHWSTTANLLTGLAILWGGFHLGLGIDSFWVASLGGALWTWLLPWFACCRLNLFPNPSHRAEFQKDLFWRMFRFGRDVFLMQLGGLLCNGSQIILVTKLLGLEAAAIFSVATKTLTMGQQLIGRILESAAPGLTEMFVRGERDRFGLRFYQMTALSIALATALGIFLVGANREFVSLWTHGKVEWNFLGDALIGAILISTVASRCLQGAFGMTGDLARVRYLSLAEGIFLIIATLALGGRGGMAGVLGVVLLSNILISLMGGGLQVARAIPARLFWEKVVWFLLAPYLLGVTVCWWAAGFFVSPLSQMLATMGWTIVSGFFLFKMLGPFFRQTS